MHDVAGQHGHQIARLHLAGLARVLRQADLDLNAVGCGSRPDGLANLVALVLQPQDVTDVELAVWSLPQLHASGGGLTNATAALLRRGEVPVASPAGTGRSRENRIAEPRALEQATISRRRPLLELARHAVLAKRHLVPLDNLGGKRSGKSSSPSSVRGSSKPMLVRASA